MLQWISGYTYLFKLVFLFLLGKYAKIKVLGHMEAQFLIFWRISMLYVFHSGSTNLYSYQKWILVICCFLIIHVLTVVRWHLFAVFICFFLLLDVEYLFICLLALFNSFLWLNSIPLYTCTASYLSIMLLMDI